MDNSNANTTNTAKIKKREPTGIAFRMLILMIIFIALIFASIFLSFNFFMEGYVKNEMRTQLSNAVSEVTTQRYAVIQRDISQLPSGGNANSNASSSAAAFTLQPDYINLYNVMMQNVNSSNSKSEVNTIIYQQSNSKRVFPDAKYFSDDRYKLFFNFDEMDYIVSTVTVNGLTEKDKFYKASVKSGNYYLTTVDLGPYYGPYWQGLSMVFYISSEKYDQLMNNIYIMILIILVIATAFTFLYVIFISRSISKPMQQLCVFADEIGRGNFTQNEYDFKDRELIDLNERMNETARKLEINDEDQKTFFQNVSHELKTPLMSIGGYAEGIKYGVFSSEKEQTGAVDIIIAESDRLKDLVEDLLYISRIDATKKFDKLTNESLGELLESCAQKLRGLLINSRSRQENGENKPEKKINIHHPKNDISILCDEESLMRAIMNIASNCLRYAKSAVDISFYETGEDIILSVKDDGGGIDEKDMPNIFKRFYKGKGGKHGIGLSIAKAIIEQHHAKITAENRKDGNGAEFLIKFNKNINEGQR